MTHSSGSAFDTRPTRPIAHVAAETGTSRACAPKWVDLRSAVDGYSPLIHTEASPDERAATATAFMHRTRAWFVTHGITRIERIVTDNGACHRAEALPRVLLGSRHRRITPYTPRHNGKVERYNRIISEEFLYARTWTSEDRRREALGVRNIRYDRHRPRTPIGNQHPAARPPRVRPGAPHRSWTFASSTDPLFIDKVAAYRRRISGSGHRWRPPAGGRVRGIPTAAAATASTAVQAADTAAVSRTRCGTSSTVLSPPSSMTHTVRRVRKWTS
ncbi:DDE-type integrase/transposase/recombinase [Streptomyces sp. TRM43335]|uniref:DDE-type integrase/transposase/recombinase n=1 Tax=Streptomyces taklimakanensis TaxID=2569853 RepID=A0A6G2B6Z0_9ACTN|nr:DDE-type integrase/transposase/recombinase [Streptomyces taklimakanensis]